MHAEEGGRRPRHRHLGYRCHGQERLRGMWRRHCLHRLMMILSPLAADDYFINRRWRLLLHHWRRAAEIQLVKWRFLTPQSGHRRTRGLISPLSGRK